MVTHPRTRTRHSRRAAFAAVVALLLVASILTSSPVSAADSGSGSTNGATVQIELSPLRPAVSTTWTRTVSTTYTPVYENQWVRQASQYISDRVIVPPWWPFFPGVIAFPGFASDNGDQYLYNAYGDPNLRLIYHYEFYEGGYVNWWWTGDDRPEWVFFAQNKGYIPGIPGGPWSRFEPDGSFVNDPGGAWFGSFVSAFMQWPNHYCDEFVRWWSPWPAPGVWVQCARLHTWLYVDRWQPVQIGTNVTTTITHSFQVRCGTTTLGTVNVTNPAATFDVSKVGADGVQVSTGSGPGRQAWNFSGSNCAMAAGVLRPS